MTVVVGILNKHGIAIAADSAVTVGGPNGRKVYNSANKIFTLSKYHPVGIAIYNNAEFMGIPWEILIKEYRKELKDKSFAKLSDYKDDFLIWFKEKKYFIEGLNDNFLFLEIASFFAVIKLKLLIQTAKQNKKDYNSVLLERLNHYINNEVSKFNIIESLQGIDEGIIKGQIEKLIPNIIKSLDQNFNCKFDKNLLEKSLINAYFQYLIHDQFFQNTGLIFTGYGESEIFPSLIAVNVSIVLNEKLRYQEDKSKKAIIDQVNAAAIRPFAQVDVIDTLLQGISAELKNISVGTLERFINVFLDTIKQIPNLPNNVIDSLNIINTNNYSQNFQNQLSDIISQKYVGPLMNAVAQISKEDLSEMAESLVYLTYLKRRFTMAEESVGGPVDVAIITKGDGFIWLKRKHYFNPELNQTFFQKYF